MKTTNKLYLVLTVLVSAYLSLSAETIAFWHFDEGTPSNTATTLSSEYNPTIMEGTAGSYASGPIPYFNDNVGHTTFRDNAGATTVRTNKYSLKFTNTGLPADESSHSGGVITIPHDDIMILSNLTVEAFIKMDRKVNYPLIIGKARADNNTTWNIDMDDSGKPRLRIDSNTSGDNSEVRGWNQSCTSSTDINDGRWHHIAFTYEHSTKAARLYLDYKQTANMTTWSNLVYETLEMRIGQGCGGRAFDGWIDEVRITDEVLQPAEFLAVIDVSGDTYSYWTFDDGPVGTEASILTNQVYLNPYVDVLHGSGAATGSGSVKPQFTNFLPSTTKMLVKDGITGATVNSNSSSLFFLCASTNIPPQSKAGSIVNISDSSLVAFPTNVTVEAFVRADRSAKWPQILGKKRSDGGDFSWSLGCEPDGSFRCRFDSTDPVTLTNHQHNLVINSGVNIYDDQWHHIAMSYHYPTKSCKIYVDYELVKTGMTLYPMYLDSGDIQIGAGDNAFDGWIDEVRITRRVLEPSDFLYLEKPPAPPGMIILIQ